MEDITLIVSKFLSEIQSGLKFITLKYVKCNYDG